MKRMLRLCISLQLIYLFGCTTIGEMSENLISVPQGKGLVLFSTGADRTTMWLDTGLMLVEGSTRRKYERALISVNYPISSDFPHEHGHVRTLALPEGDYYLLPESGGESCFLPNVYVENKAPVYKFKSSSGRISYIGNFYLSEDNVLTWSESKYKRDADYFLQRNPSLSGIPIDIQKVEVASEVSQFRVKSCIWGIYRLP